VKEEYDSLKRYTHEDHARQARKEEKKAEKESKK
jgi:hypothetical protein